jgi:nucleotide-binding universal stress UspA family protein
MYRTIVWATDGSGHAEDALPFARELAKLTGAKLVVVHAGEIFASGRAAGDTVIADEPDLAARVREQAAQLEADGFDIETRIEVGRDGPAKLIVKAADEVGADLIVVGTRGHGPLAGALIGSVAQHLLHDSHCPVFAVPPGVREPAATRA